MVGSRVYGISVFLGPVPGKILEPCPLLRGNSLEKAAAFSEHEVWAFGDYGEERLGVRIAASAGPELQSPDLLV